MAELVSIGTIAAELGLSPSYIRLLTDHGLFEAHRTAGGHRRYDLAATRQAIADCECDTGCPSCVQSPKCGSGNEPLSKDGALLLLDRLLAPRGGRGRK